MGLFGRIKAGLKKTRSGIINRLDSLFIRKNFDDDFYEELEEILIGADVGVDTTLDLVEHLRQKVKEEKLTEAEEVIAALKQLL